MALDFHKRLVKKWKVYAPARWWGDFVDIRFLLARKLSGFSGLKVLDAGCNAGILASEAAAADNTVIGIDTDFEALQQYRKLFLDLGLPPLILRGSWNSLMFREEAFDALVLGWVFYYDKDNATKIKSLEALRKTLKPGGMVYFVEANRRCPIQGRGMDCFWTPEEAVATFTEQGFEVEEVLGWNPLPSLVFWLPRAVKMRLPRKLLLCLYPPGRLVQYLPGWYALFSFLGRRRSLWKFCRSYYIRARKI